MPGVLRQLLQDRDECGVDEDAQRDCDGSGVENQKTECIMLAYIIVFGLMFLAVIIGDAVTNE